MGSVEKDDRVYHPDKGMGTVVGDDETAHGKIAVMFDADIGDGHSMVETTDLFVRVGGDE